MTEKLYDKDRCPMELQPYFGRHMCAMTAEDLHDKSDIAIELAYRDKIIDELKARVGVLEQRVSDLGWELHPEG